MKPRSIILLCFVQTRTSAISSSQRTSGPQSNLYLVGSRSSEMRRCRCPWSTNPCYHIHMPSFVAFRNIFASRFAIYHLASICASRMGFLLLITSWPSIIIGLTNPPFISGLRICLCHFWSCLSSHPSSFWPKDHLWGLEAWLCQWPHTSCGSWEVQAAPPQILQQILCCIACTFQGCQ